MLTRQCWATLLCVLIISAQALYAEDWPMWRYDSNRSAASPESLPPTLHLQWVRQLPTPRPTYPTEVRLRYDTTYEPVVFGKTIFVPSMVTDSVTAFDTDTGKQQWRFFAEGPVRFAPVAWNSKVYLVSDDGYLYCVNAKTGELTWKFRGLPEGRQDRKLMGDRRLVSLYPARGGLVLVNGIIYFGAGIWSGDGIFVHALDAESGKVVWSNTDSGHIEKANMDHGISTFTGITPQGYFAVLGKTLVVPCGLQLPALLDIETGKLGPYTMGWGARTTPRGSWFVAGSDKYLVVHGGDLYDIQKPNKEFINNMERVKGDIDFKKMLYTGGKTRLRMDNNDKQLNSFRKPIFSQGVVYTDEDGIAAHGLSDAVIVDRPIPEKFLDPKHNPIHQELVDRSEIIFKKLWDFKSDARIHIKAGNRLYCSEGSAVQALDIPETGNKPRITWKAEVKGEPYTMLAADSKLFVVTGEGRIYAFGENPEKNPVIHSLPDIEITNSDTWANKAKSALKVSGVRDGYVLILGMDEGCLAHELIRQSDCIVRLFTKTSGCVEMRFLRDGDHL